jgi:hypothetical protein
MKAFFGFLRRLWKTETFSPAAFVLRAIMITLLFGISELLGLREYTTFLSGTSANVNLSWQTVSVLGLIHLLLYVGFILLVPISLITAGLLWAWNLWQRQREIPNQKLAVSTERPLSPQA